MNESLDQKIRHRNAVARAHSQVSRGQTTMLMVKEGPVYSGRALEILRIAVVNLILTFLTVGIYRFWAKTRMRRYFVSRVSFLNDPLEYSGTGMELFIGFLIVMAVLVPFFIVVGMLQGLFMHPGTDPLPSFGFQAGYLFTFYFLYNFAVYRAQRYRLSRISWRGIRGGQEGSALLYATLAIGLGLLNTITFGLAYPVTRRILIGYRINRACFGAERLQFGGGTVKLIGAWLVPWLLGVALFGTVLYLVGTAAMEAGGEAADPNRLAGKLPLIWARNQYFLLPIAILLPFAFIWYRAIETRLWMNGASFDRLEFTSRLHLFHILIPYAIYMVLLGATIGAAVLSLAGVIKLTITTTSHALPDGTPALMAVGALVVVWMIAGLLNPVVLQNWLLRNICRTLTIQGRFSPDTLFQSQLDIPRSGEGLADALDIDAF